MFTGGDELGSPEPCDDLLNKIIPLLKSAEGQRILLTSPQERNLGFYVDRQNFRLGNIAFEALDYEVPVPPMYEGFEGNDEPGGRWTDEAKSKARIIREEMTVMLPVPTPYLMDRCALVDVRVLAQSTKGQEKGDIEKSGVPFVSLSYLKDGDNVDDWVDVSAELPLALPHSKRHRFCIECAVPAAYRGSINTWAVMVIQGSMFHPDPLVESVSKVVVPLRLSGTVVNQSSIAGLKADARAYVPDFMRRYYEKPALPLSSAPSSSLVPPFITEVVEDSHLRLSKLLSDAARHALMATLKGGASTASKEASAIIDSLVPYCHPGGTPTCHNPAVEDAGLFRKMLHLELEEAHLKDRLCEFDIYSATLQLFEKKPEDNGDRILALHVPGSNENRPEVKVGNRIYMRIDPASALELSRQTGGVVFPALFESMEVTGEVISYKLKTETACIRVRMVEIPHAMSIHFRGLSVEIRDKITKALYGPAFLNFGRNRPPNSRNRAEFNAMKAEAFAHPLTSCNWHVRFSYNASGLNFAKEACAALMHGSPIMRALAWCKPPLRSPLEPSGADQDKGLCVDHVQSGGEDPTYPPAALEGLNQRQRMAVMVTCMQVHWGRRIYGEQLAQEDRNLPPFLIFGPPGTGKTKTVCRIIEAVALLQQRQRQYKAREGAGLYILATAPSDAAADVIAMRLLARKNDDQTEGSSLRQWKGVRLHRLNWWQRPKDSVPVSLRSISFETKGGEVHLPTSHSELMGGDEANRSAVIVVATCGTAGTVRHFSDHQSPTHFDLVVVDEASQAIEAETLVPLSLCKPLHGVMVLAGDPYQLGPSVQSPFFHLDNAAGSLLDTLLKGEAYSYFAHPEARNHRSEEAQAGKYMTTGVFLVDNYRSHCDILALPSTLFYQSELVEQADRVMTGALISRWVYRTVSGGTSNEGEGEDREKHRGPEKPLSCATMSVGVNGQHQSEEGSPSYFNVTEAEEIVRLAQALLAGGNYQPPLRKEEGGRVSTRDIAVICAFRAQVLLVRNMLRKVGLGAIGVGSVEDYQGQETRIIIVSTVLSSRVREWSSVGIEHSPEGSENGLTTQVLGLSPNGLLGNARKFNVAITRGQALCVVVGKPVLLCTDPYFKHYVRACAQRGSHYGVPCPAFDAAPGSRMGKLDMAAASAESFDALGAGSSQVMGVHQEMRGESFESSQRLSWNLESTWRNML